VLSVPLWLSFSLRSAMTDKPTRGRPRKIEADAAIIEAAEKLLREGGYRALGLDEVARRAGTAKTSIYRRWPSKAALAAEIVQREVPPPTGEADRERAFEELLNGPFGGVVASLIGEAQENDDTRVIVAALIAPYREQAADQRLGAILFRKLVG
jgi:AcrR family transcriptional regulator